jgi:hypothetical protein
LLDPCPLAFEERAALCETVSDDGLIDQRLAKRFALENVPWLR